MRKTRGLKEYLIACLAGLTLCVTSLTLIFTSTLVSNAAPLGTGSQASLGVQLTINGLVRISKLNDINLGTWSGSGDTSRFGIVPVGRASVSNGETPETADMPPGSGLFGPSDGR